MAGFISRKQSFLLLLAGLCVAAGFVLVLNWFFAGPRLGGYYDFLNGRRSPPPVHQGILLVRTGEAVEAGDLFTVLLALSEFDASALVIEAPVLGSSLSEMRGDQEIRQILNDEYAVLGRNIRNLFEAIRIGSVSPSESGVYVENLVELADRGRDRLAAALTGRQGIDSALADRAAEVFEAGKARGVFKADDFRAGLPDDSGHFRSRRDFDGKIRRAAPARHVVYTALRPRWSKTGIEMEERGLVLTAGDFRFPLDIDGNILMDVPRDWDDFRVVDIEFFREYAGADRAMRQLLKEAEALGIFSELKPERVPSILYDYALSLRDAALEAASAEGRAAWLDTRAEYFRGLDDLLNSPVETKLVNAYEELIATEDLPPEGLDKLRGLRDGLIASFAAMREKYGELEDYRAVLETALNSSFCVMGPPPDISPELAVSVSLANTLLTGRCVTPAENIYIIFWSMLAVFILLTIIHFARPALMLILGIAASGLCAMGFGWSFVVSGYWIDPLIPALSCAAGTLVMFLIGSLIWNNATRRFRFAYSPAVNKSSLKRLIQAGQPSPGETLLAGAAVIAVKNADFQDRRDGSGKLDWDNPLVCARAMAEFRAEVSRRFTQAGAAFIGCEGDTALVCFGSPLERISLRREEPEARYVDDVSSRNTRRHPAVVAAEFTAGLAQNGPASWLYGIDYGECAFYWSSQTGYTAQGRPVIRARFLSSLTSRYQARILVTGIMREKLPNALVRKLHTLSESGRGIKESFFELFADTNYR